MKSSSDTLTVLLFASAKEKVGQDAIQLDLKLPASAAQLKKTLSLQYPELKPLMAISRLAVNRAFVEDSFILQGSEELAIIPPVSGG